MDVKVDLMASSSGKPRAKRQEDFKKENRLEVVKVAGEPEDETCMTFVFHDEDHTLGNSLRYIIMKNPDVQFCGYNIPHPSENKINLRVQTKGVPAVAVLRKGLKDLSQVSNHILNTFQHAVIRYKNATDVGKPTGYDSDDIESE